MHPSIHFFPTSISLSSIHNSILFLNWMFIIYPSFFSSNSRSSIHLCQFHQLIIHPSFSVLSVSQSSIHPSFTVPSLSSIHPSIQTSVLISLSSMHPLFWCYFSIILSLFSVILSSINHVFSSISLSIHPSFYSFVSSIILSSIHLSILPTLTITHNSILLPIIYSIATFI